MCGGAERGGALITITYLTLKVQKKKKANNRQQKLHLQNFNNKISGFILVRSIFFGLFGNGKLVLLQ